MLPPKKDREERAKDEPRQTRRREIHRARGDSVLRRLPPGDPQKISGAHEPDGEESHAASLGPRVNLPHPRHFEPPRETEQADQAGDQGPHLQDVVQPKQGGDDPQQRRAHDDTNLHPSPWPTAPYFRSRLT